VVVSDPTPKFGYECLACHQRVKPFRPRYPVKGRPVGSSEAVRTIGFVHAGCSLKTA